MKKILKKIYAHYLMFFGVYDAIITVMLCGVVKDTSAVIVLIALQFIETFFVWYKKVFKYRQDSTYLFGNISQNNLLAIYGGIGTGKSTLANYILNTYIKDDNLKYYNFEKKGYKAFTTDYLLLKKALPDGAGVICDEVARTCDSFMSSYDKKNDEGRSRILFYNKFFRQFYTNKALCIYIDQCEDSVNTAVRRTVFYVIQCRGLQVKAMPLLLGGIYGFINALFKFTKYNIFGLADIDFMDFNKLGSYADHYSLNYDAKDVKHFIRPAFELFAENDTYVFKKYNPCKYSEDEDYIWGSDLDVDKKIMEDNFKLAQLKEDLQNKNKKGAKSVLADVLGQNTPSKPSDCP